MNSFAVVVAASIALATVLCPAPAAALQDETLEFEGRWKVVIQPATGPARHSLLSLVNYGGRWSETAGAGARAASCRPSKPYPVTVQKSVSTELEFSVWSAEVSPGCANLSITVSPTGPAEKNGFKVLQGTTSDGRAVTMTRR